MDDERDIIRFVRCKHRKSVDNCYLCQVKEESETGGHDRAAWRVIYIFNSDPTWCIDTVPYTFSKSLPEILQNVNVETFDLETC